MALRLVITSGGATQSVTFDEGHVTIGRAPTNTLAFPHDHLMSRQHASISKHGTQWFVADLGSSNGVLLNEMPISEPTALAPGDELWIGDVRLRCTEIAPFDPGPTKVPFPMEIAPQSPPGDVPALIDDRPAMRLQGRHAVFVVRSPTPFAYGRASVLFRAETSDQRDVCIKVFHQVQGETWEAIGRFEREVVAQSQLVHPHILPVLDFGLRSGPDGSPFVAFPYCAGGSLRALMRERRYSPLGVALPLLQQAAAALDYAHASGYIHGDVKPENLLLSEDRSTLFLSDFGMSNVFALQESFSTAVPGPRGGTTAYLSPEQITANQQTPLSDIYAFTLVAYEVLTGSLPFDTTQPTFKQMTAKVAGTITDPRTFNPQIGDKVRLALLAGLDVNPLRRPRSATELCDELGRSTGGAAKPAGHPGRGARVFVSYSHRDASWLDRIRVHLRPLERSGAIDLWDDRRIKAGDQWRDEIESALQQASCAVLLVSADFIASDFCSDVELPALLQRARDRGVRILPVILSPCHLETAAGLSALQAVNSPSRTLVEMDPGEQERVLVELARAVSEAASIHQE